MLKSVIVLDQDAVVLVCTHRYTHVVGGPRQTKPARARRGKGVVTTEARHEGDDDDDDDGGGAGRRWRWE